MNTDPIALGLPHREPFIFVDQIVECDPGISATGTKTFDGNEAFFAGHFPGDPIVPGVILTEALAQVAGVAGASAAPGSRFLLSSVRSMKFLRAVRPGETIQLAARKTGELGGLLMFEAVATVGDETVAGGQIVLSGAS